MLSGEAQKPQKLHKVVMKGNPLGINSLSFSGHNLPTTNAAWLIKGSQDAHFNLDLSLKNG